MFTNNYLLYRKEMFDWKGAVKFTFHDGTTQVRYGASNYGQKAELWIDMGVIMKQAKCQTLNDLSYSYGHNREYAGVYFGTGSTPATKGDITLNEIITSGLTITNPSNLVYTDNGNGSYTVSADYVVRNTTQNDITIHEIGAFGQIMFDSSNLRPILFERTVLTEPITIAPSTPKLVTYKITFNQTLNVE